MASQMVVRRMKRELHLLSRGGAAPGISAWPRDNDGDGEGDGGRRLDVLDAEINGAADTPYEGGVFRLEVHLPSEYPLKPPRVQFVTPIYHPNIDSQGRICLDSLSMPPKGAWKPSLNIATLLTTIQALMSSPNPDDGLMVDITDEFRRNPALFNKKAREATLKHATPNSTSGIASASASVSAPASAPASSSDPPSSNGDDHHHDYHHHQNSNRTDNNSNDKRPSGNAHSQPRLLNNSPPSVETVPQSTSAVAAPEQPRPSAGLSPYRKSRPRGQQNAAPPTTAKPGPSVLTTSDSKRARPLNASGTAQRKASASAGGDASGDGAPAAARTSSRGAAYVIDEDEIQVERPSKLSRLKKRPRLR